MLDRFESSLKILCLALGAYLLFQVVIRVVHSDPLRHASIPPLPTLTVAPTNSPPSVPLVETNKKVDSSTNVVTKNLNGTNTPPKKSGDTNMALKKSDGTNAISNDVKTNAVAKNGKPRRGRGMPPGFGGPRQKAELPPSTQARVDRIKESEILGPFMRPAPTALMGIADDDAFIRSSSGQTGLVKVGDEMGGVKLLRIGLNRVLVEENGEKKELTIYDGAGGESLMPPETNSVTNANKTEKETP